MVEGWHEGINILTADDLRGADLQRLGLPVCVDYLRAEHHAAARGLLLASRRVRSAAQRLAETMLHVYVAFLHINKRSSMVM